MKTIFAVILCSLLTAPSFSQQSRIIKINTLDQETGFYGRGFLYPGYIAGKVTFNDKAISEAKLNVNCLTNQVYFLSPNGDTLILAHPETIFEIAISSDTFCFYQKGFIQKFTHNERAPNLFARQSMKYIGKEKKGAYGTYSTVGAANSNSTYTGDNQISTYLSLDENLIYQVNTEFYVSDSLNNFYPVRKGKFYSAFPQYENLIKTFVKENKIDLDKKEDLLELIKYIQTLQSRSSSTQ